MNCREMGDTSYALHESFLRISSHSSLEAVHVKESLRDHRLIIRTRDRLIA